MTTTLAFGDFVVIAGLILLFAGGAHVIMSRDPEVTRNARKLDAILDHFKIPLPPVSRPGALSSAVKTLADAGMAIEAIKLYRSETGASLGEAKVAVADYLHTRPTQG